MIMNCRDELTIVDGLEKLHVVDNARIAELLKRRRRCSEQALHDIFENRGLMFSRFVKQDHVAAVTPLRHTFCFALQRLL